MNSPMNQQPVDEEKQIGQIRQLIQKHESGIIAMPANPTPDAIAAATSLYMALIKIGKNVSLVASTIPQTDIQGADKIKTTLTTGGDNLIVSFPYQDGLIDKVDYNIEGDRFNLVIVPRDGNNKLRPDEVQFSYTGGAIDFIITIDAPSLKSLGDIYAKNESIFGGKNIVNIDRHLINNAYGTINVISKSSSSTCELVLKVIQGLNIDLDKDIATNLHIGIQAATNNLTAYSVNADTYESIAVLMRAGAQKRAMPPAPSGYQSRQFNDSPFGSPMSQPSFNMNQGMYSQPMQQSMPMQPTHSQFPQQQPQPQRPQPYPTANKQISIDQVETTAQNKEAESGDTIAENPLKPKIFSRKGGLL